MDKITLHALRGSIAKWRAIVDGSGRDEGRSNCPLCALFWQYECRGCPVFQATGKEYCHETPYSTYATSVPTLRARAAQEEVDFLQSLLPEEEPDAE